MRGNKILHTGQTQDDHKANITEKRNEQLTIPILYEVNVYSKEVDTVIIYCLPFMTIEKAKEHLKNWKITDCKNHLKPKIKNKK